MGRSSSAAAQKILRAREKALEEQRDSDFSNVMSSETGRRLMWHVLDEICQLHGGSYTQDVQLTSYNEGRRSVGIELMRHLQRVVPDRYLEMLSEQVSRTKRKKLGDEAADIAAQDEEKDEGI